MKLSISVLFLLIACLCACSPAGKASGDKPALEIAKSEYADLAKAKAVAAELEKAAAQAKQNVDEQTQ